MASPLSRVHCRVQMADGTVHEGVSIQIPPGRNTAMVRRREEQVATVAGVVAVEHQGGHHWFVRFEDGQVWDVADTPRPCGCG